MDELEDYIKMNTFGDQEMLNRTEVLEKQEMLNSRKDRKFETKIKDPEVRNKFTDAQSQIVSD